METSMQGKPVCATQTSRLLPVTWTSCFRNPGKHLLTGVEPWVMSTVNRGHTCHASEPTMTRCTLKQIWPLALVANRRSDYWQTQPKASVVSNSQTLSSRITFPIMEMNLFVSDDVDMLVAATGNLFVHLPISLSVQSQACVCVEKPRNSASCYTNLTPVWRRQICHVCHCQDSVLTLHSFP